MKRLLLFVHYNKYRSVSDYIYYQLEQLKPLFQNIIFISNSQIEIVNQIKLENLIDIFIQRDNIGFDFAAWRDGLKKVTFDELIKYDSVTLMNDTCFGPLYSLNEIYDDFENRKVDFWGITNHREHSASNSQFIDEHIQSYFQVFSRKVVESEAFQTFWSNIKNYNHIQSVIDEYETKSTALFLDKGFSYETFLDTRELDTNNIPYPNFSYFAPDVILRHKVPFIKIKIFQESTHFGYLKYIIDFIEANTDYPKSLIIDHMSKIDYPDTSYLLAEKYLLPVSTPTAKQKIAVHLHVYYTELLNDFLTAFTNFHFDYDLFITTNTNQKKEEIMKILISRQLAAEITITPNLGRDILPFIYLKNKLSKYDIVGHFHTKRSLEAVFFAGESWRNELIESLIIPADNILGNFEINPKLGIVIADVPSFFRFNRIVSTNHENNILAQIMNDLWARMKMRKIANFLDFTTFTMSYGTFFWARPKIFEPIFNLEIKDEEIPNEPLPQNTVLHAIERLLIYMAWDIDMDFRICKHKTSLSPFIDSRTHNQPTTIIKKYLITEETVNNLRLRLLIRLVGSKTLRVMKNITHRIYYYFQKMLLF